MLLLVGLEVMNLKQVGHVFAVVLAGWYLMLPPTRADLDKSCTGDTILSFTVSDAFWGLVGHWACKETDNCAKSPGEVHSFRCNVLSNEVARDAPLGLWRRIDESETLAA